MNYRNKTVYVAHFRGLNLNAFGIRQKLDGLYIVKVWQARANPELWKCSPNFQKGNLKWEAATAAELCAMVAANFDECTLPWTEMPEKRPAQPSLMNPAAEAVARRSRNLGNGL